MLVTLGEQVEDGNRVTVASAGGVSVATWMGSDQIPQGEFDVELDVDESVQWPNIVLSDEPEGLSREGDQAEVRGTVIDLADDGVLTLSVRGSILMLETEGEPRGDVEGRVVALRTTHLRLFPTGI